MSTFQFVEVIGMDIMLITYNIVSVYVYQEEV